VLTELKKYDMFLEKEVEVAVYPTHMPPFTPGDKNEKKQLFAATVSFSTI
jgi:hypothetical protein